MQAVNAWQGPGEAAFDFRSDVMTRPTPSMLDAITNTSLGDDVLQEDAVTVSLEQSIAELANHESALLVMSGTMGNQVGIRTHLTQPPYAVLCDHRAHIINYEGGGVSTWTGAYVKGIVPKNGRYLTLEDIKPHAVLGDDIHGCPTRLISLENTLDGMIMPLDEMKRISKWAHESGLKVHLDGARLWEAVVAGAGSISSFTSLVDSVSLCFSKGLGAPIGSILVGSKEYIKKARWFRKSIGGGTRQSGVISAAARVAVNETFGSGQNGEGSLLLNSHLMAKKIATMWTEKGGKLNNPVETNMVWLDLDAAGVSNDDWVEIGRQHGLKLMGGRMVVHYQISLEALDKLDKAMDLAMSGKFTSTTTSEKNGQYCGQT
ncbi:threonine aldolase [Arthroderma uncinatum]|uniref:threonine aldolase n=1 Tax=Arthroderma uncinatum TaxID=74035 RepID=UPI00144AB411|nr:threonine aldolase [Arthroderma uncinatum]KAF3481844.1 threonine aldolase [Arthroderma uncinatum]